MSIPTVQLPTGVGVRIDHFWSQVEKTADCWLWRGYVNARGYGEGGGRESAHRVSYQLAVGPIPDGLELDHLCAVTHCVNPDHLEPVTPAENVRRAVARRTHCRRGHEYTPETTRYENGSRRCKLCDNRQAMCSRCHKGISVKNMARHRPVCRGAFAR